MCLYFLNEFGYWLDILQTFVYNDDILPAKSLCSQFVILT